MSTALYTDTILILMLLFSSALFASAEVVFFGIKSFTIEGKNKIEKIAKKLLEHPYETLVSILLGNEIVNIFLSSFMTKKTVDMLGQRWSFVSSFIVTFLIFIFGETIPKNLALFYKERLLNFYTIPFYLFYILISPLRTMLVLPTNKIFGYLKLENLAQEKISIESLINIVQSGLKEGKFDQEEIEMLKKVSKMSEVIIREIMIPRLEIFSLNEDSSVKEVIEDIIKNEHSRIPIYKDNQDNLTGFIQVKDLLPIEQNKDKKLKEFKRKLVFVPEVMNIEDFLKEMKSSKNYMAAVIDEHGALSGLITIYDVLEWLIGDIPAESEDESEIVKISSEIYKVDGSTDIEYVSQVIGLNLPKSYAYDTISGFIMTNLGKIPEEGDEFDYEGFKFIVDKVEGKKIVEVLIKTPLKENV